jgi:hypothetical protein
MFTSACIAIGLIVASILFALLGPSGPKVTLSDIARQTETMHRSQSIRSRDIEYVENEPEARGGLIHP